MASAEILPQFTHDPVVVAAALAVAEGLRDVGADLLYVDAEVEKA